MEKVESTLEGMRPYFQLYLKLCCVAATIWVTCFMFAHALWALFPFDRYEAALEVKTVGDWFSYFFKILYFGTTLANIPVSTTLVVRYLWDLQSDYENLCFERICGRTRSSKEAMAELSYQRGVEFGSALSYQRGVAFGKTQRSGRGCNRPDSDYDLPHSDDENKSDFMRGITVGRTRRSYPHWQTKHKKNTVPSMVETDDEAKGTIKEPLIHVTSERVLSSDDE